MATLRQLTLALIPQAAKATAAWVPFAAAAQRGLASHAAAEPNNQTARIKELREKSGAPISDVKARYLYVALMI